MADDCLTSTAYGPNSGVFFVGTDRNTAGYHTPLKFAVAAGANFAHRKAHAAVTVSAIVAVACATAPPVAVAVNA